MTKKIGRCIKVDVDNQGKVRRSSLRIKVLININKPLRRGVKLQIKGIQELQWFYIQYKRMPNFCYCCGLLGHDREDCKMEGENDEDRGTSYGDWIRAKGFFVETATMMKGVRMEGSY